MLTEVSILNPRKKADDPGELLKVSRELLRVQTELLRIAEGNAPKIEAPVAPRAPELRVVREPQPEPAVQSHAVIDTAYSMVRDGAGYIREVVAKGSDIGVVTFTVRRDSAGRVKELAARA